MSFSCVAGGLALILQANPYLSVSQVKEIIHETATNDHYTTQAGVNRFGYGKINAYQAVLKALNTVSVEDYTETPVTQYTIFPNPTDGRCYVTVNSDAIRIQYALYDLTGRGIAKNQMLPGVNHLDMQSLPSGCYILRLSDGKQIVSKKIIKH